MRRPFPHGLLGPLFAYDLIASTRRGQHLGLRMLVGLVLLVGLYLLYSLSGFDPFDSLTHPTKRINQTEAARLGQGFAATCLVVQFALILLLTPAMLGEAIAREKERRTLDFLFVTELTDREIIVGKLLARLTYLAGVVMTSLPVLSLVQLFGGIDPEALLASYAVMLTTLLSLGSVSILLSVWAKTALEATLCSYFLAGCYGAACPCVLTPVWSSDASVVTGLLVSVGVNLGISVLCVTVAVRELRARAVPPHLPRPPEPSIVPTPPPKPKPKPAVAPLVLSVAEGEPAGPPPLVTAVEEELPATKDWGYLDQPGPRPRPRQPPVPEFDDPFRPPKPPVDDRPLLWKELYFHAVTRDVGAPPRDLVIALVILGVAFLWLVWLAMMANPGSVDDITLVLNGVVRFLTVILAGVLGLGVIAHTAGSVTRERERDTLIGLLTIPEARTAILEAKWLAAFGGLRGVLIALGVVWLFGLLTGALHPWSLVWLVLTVAAPLECLASLGLWLSVLNKTTLRANMAAALCLLMMAAGPWIVMNYVEWLTTTPGRSGEATETVMSALMPPVAWVQAAVSWDGYAALPKGRYHVWLAGALAYALVAWALWRMACARFAVEKLGKGR